MALRDCSSKHATDDDLLPKQRRNDWTVPACIDYVMHLYLISASGLRFFQPATRHDVESRHRVRSLDPRSYIFVLSIRNATVRTTCTYLVVIELDQHLVERDIYICSSLR